MLGAGRKRSCRWNCVSRQCAGQPDEDMSENELRNILVKSTYEMKETIIGGDLMSRVGPDSLEGMAVRSKSGIIALLEVTEWLR
jgi:hypothetical protein